MSEKKAQENEEDFLECWSCGGNKVRLRIDPYTEKKALYYGQCPGCGSEGIESDSREGAVSWWNTTTRGLKKLLMALEKIKVDNDY